MWWMLVPVSHAESIIAGDAACAPIGVTQSVPRAGQADVPVDVHPTLVFEGDCGGATNWTIDIVDATGAVVATRPWAWSGVAPAIATFDLGEDLPAAADLTLRVTPAASEGWSGTYEIPFSTGTGRVIPASGLPSADITAAQIFESSDTAEVAFTVIPAVDPQNLSILQVSGDGVSTLLAAGATTGALGWPAVDTAADLCVTVTQIDGTGASLVGEPVCAPPDLIPEGGCSSIPGGASVVLVAGAAGWLAATRRRR
jgi:hypothetical protein